MRRLELKTFKGCCSALNFYREIEELVSSEDIDLKIEYHIVPSSAKAGVMGLFGSPTLIFDGREYQEERRGPAGFY